MRWDEAAVVVAARLMPARRRAWGQAMRADLAHLDDPVARRDFAVGCLRVAALQPALPILVCCLMGAAVAARTVAERLPGGLFRAEVLTLILVVPPLLWLLGRRPGLLGAVGAGAACRVGRPLGYGLVGACAALAVRFVGAEVLGQRDGASAAPLVLTVVLLALAAHLAALVAATSENAGLPPSTIGLAAGFGGLAAPAGFLLLPLNQPLATGPFWAWCYPAALGLVVVAPPALAAFLATRRDGYRQGFLAAAGAGSVAALTLFALGLAVAQWRPGLADSAIVDQGALWVPPEPLGVAAGYLAGLVLLPVGAALIGVAAGQRSRAVLVALAVALGYPAVAALHGAAHPGFGPVGATAVSFATGRPALLTSDADGLAVLWSLAGEPVPVKTFRGSARFSPDGRTMATRDRLWDMTDPAHPSRVGGFSGGDPVALAGTVLAAQDGRGYSLWDVADRAHPRQLARVPATGVAGAGNVAALSADGSVFASSDIDAHRTTVWRVAEPDTPVTIATGAGWGHDGPALSPDGRLVAVVSEHGTAGVWDLADFRHPVRVATTGAGVATLVWAPGGRLLAVGGQDAAVTLWDLSGPARRVAVLPAARPSPNTQIGVSDTLTRVAFSADGRTLATVAGNTVGTRWDIGDPARPRSLAVFTRETSGPGVLGFSPDLARLAGAAEDEKGVAVWVTHRSFQ